MNNRWISNHAAFFSALMDALNQEGIRYFVLRNFEELPENNTGSDVDIIIEPGSYAAAAGVMKECARREGWAFSAVMTFDRKRSWYLTDATQSIGIHFDLMENEVYHGFTYFRFDELYQHVIPCKNFYVLDPTWHAVMLLVQNLVAYKNLKPKYQAIISANYRHTPEPLERVLVDFWGQRAADEVIACIRQEDYDRLVAEAPLLSQVALRRIFLKRPFDTTLNVLGFLMGKTHQLVWCPKRTRRFIAVEAPDGTGKTTFIEALLEQLKVCYVSSGVLFCVHHFRPEILPNLGAVGEKAGVMKQDKDFTRPHRAKPAGFIASLLRMGYYWLDYVIGVPLLLRREAQYGRYTIFDRYSYDFLVDPRRSRINLPKWLRWLFVRLTPQPDIVFVLRADAETIYRRKQELTPEEIERQLAEFAGLDRLGKRCVFIDATQTPQEMARQALRHLLERYWEKR